MSRKWQFLNALAKSNAGNVLPMAAVATLVGVALIGGGVDMSRAYRADNRLQSACDAAVLAGRKAVADNGFDDEAEEVANRYFNTNFDEGSQEVSNVNFVASSDDNGNTVVGNATATQKTALMNVVGFEQFDLSVDCSASMGVGNSDVIMVLDTTGSMDWDLPGSSQSRISALQDAMKNFYDTLDSASSGTSARIRYGFVPFSQSVNVGGLSEADWIVDEYNYASRRPDYDLQTTQVFDHWGDPVYTNDTSTENNSRGRWSRNNPSYNHEWQCENNLPDNTAWQNNGDSYTEEQTYESNGNLIEIVSEVQPQSRTAYRCRKRRSNNKYYVYDRDEYRDYVSSTTATSEGVYTEEEVEVFDRWIYDQVALDTSVYKTFVSTPTLTGGAQQGNHDSGPIEENGEPRLFNSTWSGCIIERETVAASSFSYSTILGWSPSDAYDLDLDSEPDLSDPDTQWAPLWPEVAYRRWDDSHYTVDATTSGQSMRSDAHCPVQARLLAEMDETAFDNYANSLTPNGNTYLDIGMIWGGRLSSPTGLFESNVMDEPANGAEVARHLIFMTDGDMDTENDHPTAYGIERNEHRVTDDGYSNQDSRHISRFTAICQAIKAKGVRIWVIAFAGTTIADNPHLQTCASDSSAFQANNASQLNAAFQEIAKQVGELRIIQ